MDGPGAHRPLKVREPIEGRGCELPYPPPYSPNLNPTEEALRKLEQILRKNGARGEEPPIEAMGRSSEAVSTEDVRGFVRSPWLPRTGAATTKDAVSTGSSPTTFGARASVMPSHYRSSLPTRTRTVISFACEPMYANSA